MQLNKIKLNNNETAKIKPSIWTESTHLKVTNLI